jgi:hypothetical protein
LGEILAVAGVSPAQITPVAAINLKHDRNIENILFVEVFTNPKVGQFCFGACTYPLSRAIMSFHG